MARSPDRSKSHRPKADAPPALTREAVVAYIAAHGADVGKREIARAFGIKGEDRVLLKHLLAELEDEGALNRNRRKLHRAGMLEGELVADILRRDDDGDLIAEPSDWDTDLHGPAPEVLVLPGGQVKPPPGIGDRVLIMIEERPEGGARHFGRVVKLLDHRRNRIVGVFRTRAGGGGFIIPADKKAAGRVVDVDPRGAGDAEDGDIVSADLRVLGRRGEVVARVRERFGSLAQERAASLIAIHAHEIPHIFPPAVLAEAESAPADAPGSREDLTDRDLITIDPADAKDHDDAVHARADDDPANAGGYIVTVAIADVAAYVRPGTALDREALNRGNSVYFPDRVVPMLPERLSNDLCSLKPGVVRPALAVELVLGPDGEKKRHRFRRILMRSRAKLSYQQAQDAIDGRPDAETGPLMAGVLEPLWAAYRCAGVARAARGPLELDLPERKILLKPDGTVDRVIVPERLDAHKLIEEFMILANVAAAEELEKARVKLVYRVHDAPSAERLAALKDVLATMDLKLPTLSGVRAHHFNGILAKVRGAAQETLVNEMVLRSQAQAEYSAENYGHYGLSLARYAHFTSPIRRYADLIVHRALVRALKFGADGLPDSMGQPELAEIAARISAAERRAMIAERETVDRLIAHHLADKVGASFGARIGGVTKAGLFVRLDDTGADGLVPVRTLGAEFFSLDEKRMALVGSRTGTAFAVGDRVRVRLVEAAPVAGALRFEIAGGDADSDDEADEHPRRGVRVVSRVRHAGPPRRGRR